MTEWNAKTSCITGKDIAEKINLKSGKPEIVPFKESNDTKTSTNGMRTVGADSDQFQSGIKMDELEGNLLDMDNEHLSRRLPPPKQLQRTDSNLTIDSDLSSDLHNSPIAWEKSSGESRNQYLMNQNLIEIEACTRAARRSGMANYTSNLADIKETSFDFDKTPRSPLSESQNLKNTFDFEKVPISPLQSPKSPVTRTCSAGNFKQVSQKVHSQLKRSLTTQENTYAARRKVLTKSIQEWVNSIDKSPQLEEDDDEALSFLPIGQSSKENIITQMPCKTDSATDHGIETVSEESTSKKQPAGDLSPSEIGNLDLYDGHSQHSDGEVKESTSKGISQLTNYSRIPIDRPSHADLLMMASHYRQEHSKSPITRVQRLHNMGVSQSSDVSTSSSTRSNNSLDEILNNRDDPEQILLDLGFGSKEPEIFDRIPARFYSKPSKARGMNIGQFLNSCHEQEMKSSNDLNIGGGFRSLFGILQWSRERQGKGIKKSESARKKSAANALNMWKNKTSKANTESKDKVKKGASNIVKDCKNQVEETNCAKVDADDKSSDAETNSGSLGVADQTPEFRVKEETSASSDCNGLLCQEEVQGTVHNDEESGNKDRQHWILPLPNLTDDSEGSITSKKSSSSTLGDSSSITLITKMSDKLSFEKSEETASDSLLVTSPEIYSVKDQLRRLPGHVLGNTPQESFEFEEVSTASEMMEEERLNLEKQSAMKGKLSRAGSAQSDSSGFADDLVEVTVASLLSQQLDISDDVVCVHDKDVQTNSNEFLCNEEHTSVNDTEQSNSIEDDSPFDDRYQETTPRKRTRHDTFPRTSERVPWSADHPRSVIEILKTLKVNSGNENHMSHSKRSPLLKLKSVYADYPEELPTTSNLSSMELQSLDLTDQLHDFSEPSSLFFMSSAVQETNSQMSSMNSNVQNCDSCLPSIISTLPQSHSSHLPSIDLSSQPSNSSLKPSMNMSLHSDSPLFTLSESNSLQKFENFECPRIDSLTLDNLICKSRPVVSTEEPTNVNTHTISDNSVDVEEPKTAVTSNLEVYLAKDYRGLSNVTSSNDNCDLSTLAPNKQIPDEKSTDGEHDKVCCNLNKMIGSVKSCYYIQPQMSNVETKNSKQQVALQDIQLLHRAISSYKSELVELEGLSDQIYQIVHSHLTLNERYQLGSLRTLRLQVMDEVESIEKLLLSLAKTISNEPQVKDFPGAYRNSLDHLQVLKQMITLLQEQKMLRDMLGSLEVEYQIAYGSVMQERPVQWTSERAELIQQLMDLKTVLDRQRQTSQKDFASSLQEMKHGLLQQLRNDVLEETENLRSQLKLKETEVENLRRQLQSTCDGNSN